MLLPRRRFLHLAAGAVALPAAARVARADTYPSRPVHIVIGFPPGQSADISARLLGQWLSERLGQTFVIDNKPGASSSVATELVGARLAGRLHAAVGRDQQLHQRDALQETAL